MHTLLRHRALLRTVPSKQFSTSPCSCLPRAIQRTNPSTSTNATPPNPDDSAAPKSPSTSLDSEVQKAAEKAKLEKLRKLTAEVFKEPGKACLIANVRPSELPPIEKRTNEDSEDEATKHATKIRRVFPSLGLLPEVVVTGRANSGKSSLFNAVIGRKDMIPTSSKAGRTRRLDFYRVGSVRDRQVVLVDAPGYGERGRPEWGRLFDEYVKHREGLRCVYITFNAKHTLNEYDVQMLQHLTRSLLQDFRSRILSSSLSSTTSKRRLVTLQPVITKADLLPNSQADARQMIQKLKAGVKAAVGEVVSDEIDAGVGQATSRAVEVGQRDMKGGVKAIVDAILLEPILTSVEMSPPFGIEEVRRSVVKCCIGI